MSLSSNVSSAMMPSRSTANPEDVLAAISRVFHQEEPPPKTALMSPLPNVPYENPITQLNAICLKRRLNPVYNCKPYGPRKAEWLCSLTLSPKGDTSAPDKTFELGTPAKTQQAAKAYVAVMALKILDRPKGAMAALHGIRRILNKDKDQEAERRNAKREKMKAKRNKTKQKKSKAHREAGQDQDDEGTSLCSAGSQGLREGLQMQRDETQIEESEQDVAME